MQSAHDVITTVQQGLRVLNVILLITKDLVTVAIVKLVSLTPRKYFALVISNGGLNRST